jgi:hypothetical protein
MENRRNLVSTLLFCESIMKEVNNLKYILQSGDYDDPRIKNLIISMTVGSKP